jgi:hypothetical protein
VQAVSPTVDPKIWKAQANVNDQAATVPIGGDAHP